MKRTSAPLEIHKFGGASVAKAESIAHAASIVLARRPARMVIVVSALEGVTDTLIGILRRAEHGDADGARTAGRRLRKRYDTVARALLKAGTPRQAVSRSIDEAFTELEHLIVGLAALRDLTTRTSDYVVARGERLSARLFAAALEQAGAAARFVDGPDVVKTNGESPDLVQTARAAKRVIGPLLARGVIPVVPGFIGAGSDGEVTTLGRGGSDLSATLLGSALGARQVTLWKDVPGLLTADPRTVPDARVVPQIHFREASELAYYGARVLHPRALIPAARARFAVRIRSFKDIAAPGTEISRRKTAPTYPVKALSAIPAQALLTIAGNGMLGVPGIAARTFAAVQREGISVSLISQASSEHSICFSVPQDSADRARAALRRTFAYEIERREIDGVEVRRGLATLVIVGLGLARAPGIAARAFAALDQAGVDVIATAQGSSELNLSLVLDEHDAPRALRAVHAAFHLSKIGGGAVTHAGRTDVVLLGFGQIGRTLAAQLARIRRRGSAFRVVALLDRSGFVFDARGLPARRLAALARLKTQGTPLARAAGGRKAPATEAIRAVAGHALSNPVLVDVTAADTTESLIAALELGMHVVLANKQPMTADQETYARLRAAARTRSRELLHEATVGAGLPIIDTFRKLVDSGDRVLRIEGCPSGTLGYLFGEMGRGRRFSESLRGAIERGYPEPDPRADLSGMDVARKALILGRLLGFRGELADVAVESLVPKGAERIPLERFLEKLESYDDQWERRIVAAREGGGVLRYRVVVTRSEIRVGLVVVPAASSMAALQGTDNQFIFTTARYRKNPLVISGPGAGPAVTAGGILNDLQRVAGG